jgi:hypothetical protein
VQVEDGSFTVTLDASNREEWVGFSFELGRVVPQGLAADIYFRRHYLQAPRGAADLGPVALQIGSRQIGSGQGTEWVEDVVVDGVQRNPALSRWYDYSYMTHLLKPRGHTYAVRLAEGAATMQVVSYYCLEPEGTGCLSLRYRVPG